MDSEKWYYTDGGETYGPFTRKTLELMLLSGQISLETLVALDGEETWRPLHERQTDLKGLSNNLRLSRTGSKLGEEKAAHSVIGRGRSLATSLGSHASIFAMRILRSNFLVDDVTPDERLALMRSGIESPQSQNYLGWRRALLWFAGVLLGSAMTIGLKQDLKGIEGAPKVLQILQVSGIAFSLLACFLAIKAALYWKDVRQTKSMARFSWFCLFVLPLLLALIPVSKLTSRSYFDYEDQRQWLGMAMGAMYVITFLPSLLSLFPALVRSSLTLKTLLPESPMPGWIAVVIAPLYSLFFFLAVVVAVQIDNTLLSISMLAFSLAPLVISWNVNRLVQPSSEPEALAAIRSVRRKTMALMAVGGVVGLLAAFDLLDSMNLEAMEVTRFICKLGAAFFLMTVVTSDFLIGMFKTAYDRENVMREGELGATLGRRFEDLDALGLTDLRAGERELLQGIRDRMGSNS